MRRRHPEPVAIAILAKAPIPGLAKTRLIPALGAEGAAALQARLIARAVDTAIAAGTGPATLWASPDESHPDFQSAKTRYGLALARQPNGDLGHRMFTALAAAHGPALVIGSDCPALTPAHLRACAEALRDGIDAAVIPAEDGGYVLLGTRHPNAHLFVDMPWGTPLVMGETRSRLARLSLAWREPARLWDVDRPEDLARLAEIDFA
jgi:rSAM/selenodomain-associated transferase 1